MESTNPGHRMHTGRLTTHHNDQPPTQASGVDDPSQTKTLRSRWIGALNRLWRTVRGRIRNYIQDQDALELTAARGGDTTSPTATVLSRFRRWFTSLLDEVVVESMPIERVRTGTHRSGQRIRAAYEHGLRLGDRLLRRAEYERPNQPPTAIHSAPHRETIRPQYLQTYRDLEGAAHDTERDVTRTLDDALGRTMADGGRDVPSKEELVTRINERVAATGQPQTQATAATRAVETTNYALARRFEQAGVEEVGIQSPDELQWQTAGDRHVCEECQSLSGSTYALSDVLAGNAPLPARDTHPFCRCAIRVAI